MAADLAANTQLTLWKPQIECWSSSISSSGTAAFSHPSTGLLYGRLIRGRHTGYATRVLGAVRGGGRSQRKDAFLATPPRSRGGSAGLLDVDRGNLRTTNKPKTTSTARVSKRIV